MVGEEATVYRGVEKSRRKAETPPAAREGHCGCQLGMLNGMIEESLVGLELWELSLLPCLSAGIIFVSEALLRTFFNDAPLHQQQHGGHNGETVSFHFPGLSH